MLEGVALDRLLWLVPNDNIDFSRSVVPAAQPDVMERYIEGLREAGLPD